MERDGERWREIVYLIEMMDKVEIREMTDMPSGLSPRPVDLGLAPCP